MVPVRRIICTLLLLTSAGLIAGGSWAAHHWPFRQDRHLFELMGQCLLDGGRIYLDCWDNKPPLVPWINAVVLGLCRDSTQAITAAAGLAAATAVAAVALGTWRWHGPIVGCLTALMASGTFSLRYYDGCTNGTELYGAMFESLAATAFLLPWRRGRAPSVAVALTAGACFGAAFGCKQNLLAGPLSALGMMAAAGCLNRGLRGACLRSSAALICGFVAVVGAIAGVLFLQGVLADAVFAICGVNRLFAQAGLCWWNPWTAGVGGVLLEQTRPLRPLVLTAALGLAAGLVERRGLEPRGDRPAPLPALLVGMLGLWMVLALWEVLPGGCHLTRYWHAVFVPLLWLAAQTLHYLAGGLAAGPAAQRLVLASAAIAGAVGLWTPVALRQKSDLWQAQYHRTEDCERARLRELAAAVAARTSPGERIYVWGYEPGIYRFAHRRAPGRFAELGKVPFLEARAQFMVDEVLGALTGSPPRLILVQEEYQRVLEAGRYGPVDISGLRTLLAGAYRGPVLTMHGFSFYERAVETTAPATATGPLARDRDRRSSG